MIYEDKSLEWFKDFERKAYSLIYTMQMKQQTRDIVAVAKTYLKVRKAKIKKFGSDGIPRTKVLQLQTVVKTYGLFIKPYPINKIIYYDGVIFTDKMLGIETDDEENE